MSTFAEVEKAVNQLSVDERQRLLLKLISGLRTEGQTLPPPRKFSREQILAWIEEDERAMAEIRGGR